MVALKAGIIPGIVSAITGDEGEVVGSTTVDLEDRWYCEEWQTETINKPREIRDLYKASEPGLSVGKLQLLVDAYTQVMFRCGDSVGYLACSYASFPVCVSLPSFAPRRLPPSTSFRLLLSFHPAFHVHI